MFVGNADFINTELTYLKPTKEWSKRWRPAIIESAYGSPVPYFKYLRSSGNLIDHAYHLARFEEETEIKIDCLKCIFEFGGGYGSMCRLVHNLGFRGKYVIFDLPHFSILQKYYLSGLGIEVNSNGSNVHSDGVYCVNDLDDLKKLDIGGDDSLFLAAWSYSEAPIPVRESLVHELGLCQAHLIAYQDVFGEVNNVKYFSERQSFRSYRNKLNEKILHLPGSRYLFGWEGQN
jgi:hypothetical protein